MIGEIRKNGYEQDAPNHARKISLYPILSARPSWLADRRTSLLPLARQENMTRIVRIVRIVQHRHRAHETAGHPQYEPQQTKAINAQGILLHES